MKRIRSKNVNTTETFDEVFQSNIGYYNSYGNIRYYNKSLGLKLFDASSYLDYGCGGGIQLQGLVDSRPGLRVMGVDISEFVIAKNKSLYPDCFFFTVDSFWETEAGADNILSSHTFEHVEDPLVVAKKLLDRCGKSLTIIVPHEESWAECEQHIWKFDLNSFKQLNPTLVTTGLTNRAGNTELIIHWRKDGKRFSLFLMFVFHLRKLYKNHPIGMLKVILKKIKAFR